MKDESTHTTPSGERFVAVEATVFHADGVKRCSGTCEAYFVCGNMPPCMPESRTDHRNIVWKRVTTKENGK